MTETAKATPDGEVRTSMYRVVIRASIDTVWSELIRTDRPLPFFFGGQYDTPGLKPGAPFAMRTPDGKFTLAMGEVIEFDPPHRYAHTFRFTTSDDPVSVVRYVLKEVEGGTEFTLINEHPARDPVPDPPRERKNEVRAASIENRVVEAGVAQVGFGRLP